jgi:hypothetical protein
LGCITIIFKQAVLEEGRKATDIITKCRLKHASIINHLIAIPPSLRFNGNCHISLIFETASQLYGMPKLSSSILQEFLSIENRMEGTRLKGIALSIFHERRPKKKEKGFKLFGRKMSPPVLCYKLGQLHGVKKQGSSSASYADRMLRHRL